VLVPAVALLCAALVAHVGNRATAGAESALGQGDDASAFSQARRASRWSPWAALPHELAGEAQLARHHDRGARRELKRALELDPDSWRAWYDLATVTQGAEHARALAKAHALNPLAPELSDEP
jgi:Flp pilus assembly protein TadD